MEATAKTHYKNTKPMSARKGEELMIEKTLAEEISKREFQIVNRDKMIRYLQEEHKKRGKEIVNLKAKLHKRNVQIKRLKATIKQITDKYDPANPNGKLSFEGKDFQVLKSINR